MLIEARGCGAHLLQVNARYNVVSWARILRSHPVIYIFHEGRDMIVMLFGITKYTKECDRMKFIILVT